MYFRRAWCGRTVRTLLKLLLHIDIGFCSSITEEPLFTGDIIASDEATTYRKIIPPRYLISLWFNAVSLLRRNQECVTGKFYSYL